MRSPLPLQIVFQNSLFVGLFFCQETNIQETNIFVASVPLELRITYEIKPGIFDEKRGNAALLIKNSGFYFIFDPKQENQEPISGKQVRLRCTCFPEMGS